MRFRYLSLFFASIGPRQALLALYYGLTAMFSGELRRHELERLVKLECGVGQVLAYSSARGSLTAFLRAAEIGPGDSVLLSCFTCLAVPSAVIACGARPIYADVDSSTLNVNLESILESVEDDTKAIVVQHTMGCPVDEISEICKFAKDTGLLVIEDCALSIGTRSNGIPIGFHGDAAIFSLELSKTLSSGWGGVLVNNNQDLESVLLQDYENTSEESRYTQMRKVLQITLTGLFYSKYVYFFGKYLISAGYKVKFFKGSTPDHEQYGKVNQDFVSRLGCAQTKLAISQFKRINEVASINNRNFLYLQKCLKDAGIEVLGVASKEDFPVSPRVAFLVEDPQAASVWFYRKGIELGRWFDGPLSPLPIFNFDVSQFPNVKKISNHIVNLPCHNRLTKSDLVWFNNIIQMFVKENPSECDFRFNK